MHLDSVQPCLEEAKLESPELPFFSSALSVSSPVLASFIALSSSGKVILQTVPAILCGSNGRYKVVIGIKR